jgi:hypothetical protein
MRVLATLTGVAFVLAMQGSSLAQETPAKPEAAQAQSEQAPPDQADQSDQHASRKPGITEPLLTWPECARLGFPKTQVPHRT